MHNTMIIENFNSKQDISNRKSTIKIYKDMKKPDLKKIHSIYIIARYRNQVLFNHVENRNYKFTFYRLTSSHCKVIDGVVRNLFKLILRKPRLKFIRLGLVTKFDGRLFHG